MFILLGVSRLWAFALAGKVGTDESSLVVPDALKELTDPPAQAQAILSRGDASWQHLFEGHGNAPSHLPFGVGAGVFVVGLGRFHGAVAVESAPGTQIVLRGDNAPVEVHFRQTSCVGLPF